MGVFEEFLAEQNKIDNNNLVNNLWKKYIVKDIDFDRFCSIHNKINNNVELMAMTMAVVCGVLGIMGEQKVIDWSSDSWEPESQEYKNAQYLIADRILTYMETTNDKEV